MVSLNGDGDLHDLPVFLTVEEASALLRIGRTKAYAMAKEWRDTGGVAGLPVVDLGHVLRVPRRALEELVGAESSDVVFDGGGNDEAVVRTDEKPKAPSADPGSGRPRKPSRRNRTANQLDLFESESRSD